MLLALQSLTQSYAPELIYEPTRLKTYNLKQDFSFKNPCYTVSTQVTTNCRKIIVVRKVCDM